MSGWSTARSTSRSAGKFVVHVDGNWQKSDDLRTGGHILSKDLREAGAGQPRSGNPGACRPQRRSSQFRGGVQGRRDRRRLCRWRSQHRRVGDPPPRDLPGSDPLFARSGDRARSADHRPGADALRLPRGNSGQRVLQPRPRARRLCQLSSRRARRHGRRSDPASSARAAKAGSSWSSPSAPAGAGRAASSTSTATRRSVGEEKFLPDSRQRQAGLFTLQTLVSGPLRVEGGARVEFSKLERRCRRSARDARALAQLHDLVRLARRPVRILAWAGGPA